MSSNRILRRNNFYKNLNVKKKLKETEIGSGFWYDVKNDFDFEFKIIDYV